VCEACSKLDEKLSSTRNCTRCIESVHEVRQLQLIERHLEAIDAELAKDISDKLSARCLHEAQQAIDALARGLRPNNEAAYHRLRAAQDALQIAVDTDESSKDLGTRIAHMTSEALKPGDVWLRSMEQIERTHAQLRKGVKAILERARTTPGAEEAHRGALQALHEAVAATEARTVRDKLEQLEIVSASEEEDLEAFARIIRTIPVDLLPTNAPTLNQYRNKAVAVERLAWNIDQFDSPMIMISSEACIESPTLMPALVAVIAGTEQLEDKALPLDRREAMLTYNDCVNRALDGVATIAKGYRAKDSPHLTEGAERNLRAATAAAPGLLAALAAVLRTSEYPATVAKAAQAVSALAGPSWRQPSARLCREAGLVAALAQAEVRLAALPGVERPSLGAIREALKSIAARDVVPAPTPAAMAPAAAPAPVPFPGIPVPFPGAPPPAAEPVAAAEPPPPPLMPAFGALGLPEVDSDEEAGLSF